jgi:hypothetical protein
MKIAGGLKFRLIDSYRRYDDLNWKIAREPL